MPFEREDLRRVFAADKWPTLNKLQVESIAALMERGNQAGGPEAIGPTRGYADPPRALMIVATHPRAEGVMSEDAPASEIVAIADDGRTWTIARAGIAWPLDSNPVEPIAASR
jgi:hypothetical protein